jgi:hypothetical protein
MAYYKAKLKSIGDAASPSFGPSWIGKLSTNIYLLGLYCTFHLNII